MEPVEKMSFCDDLNKDFLSAKFVGRYSVQERLGSGSFSVVKKGYCAKEDCSVALKIMELGKEVTSKEIQKEAENMIRLKRHPNILSIKEVIRGSKFICLVLEYAPIGDLQSFVASRGKLSERYARKLFVQIAKGVKYCHDSCIIHGDIKAENIFLQTPTKIKIGDFGFSQQHQPGGHIATHCGSLHYAAPEILMQSCFIYSAVDIWAMGVLLYFLVRSTNNCSTKYLSWSQAKRVDVDEVLAHPWFKAELKKKSLSRCNSEDSDSAKGRKKRPRSRSKKKRRKRFTTITEEHESEEPMIRTYPPPNGRALSTSLCSPPKKPNPVFKKCDTEPSLPNLSLELSVPEIQVINTERRRKQRKLRAVMQPKEFNILRLTQEELELLQGMDSSDISILEISEIETKMPVRQLSLSAPSSGRPARLTALVVSSVTTTRDIRRHLLQKDKRTKKSLEIPTHSSLRASHSMDGLLEFVHVYNQEQDKGASTEETARKKMITVSPKKQKSSPSRKLLKRKKLHERKKLRPPSH